MLVCMDMYDPGHWAPGPPPMVWSPALGPVSGMVPSSAVVSGTAHGVVPSPKSIWIQFSLIRANVAQMYTNFLNVIEFRHKYMHSGSIRFQLDPMNYESSTEPPLEF